MVESQIDLLDEIAAPVGKGQRLGTLTLKVGQQALKEIPLVAQEGVARLTWGEIFWQILRKIAFQ